MKANRYAINTLVAAVAAAIGLSLVTRVQAAEENEPAKKSGIYNGIVESVDEKARTLSVKNESSAMTFLVAKDAKVVTKEKVHAALSDLKAGDKVRVDYRDDS